MSLAPKPFDPDEFERDFWEPIGRYVITFGFLEKEVDWSIGKLLSVHDRQAEAVTSQIKNMSARIRLIRKLVYLLVHSNILRMYANLYTNELRVQNSFRNNLVHGPWTAYSMSDGYWQKVRVDGNDFKYKTFEVHKQEIEDMRIGAFHLKNRLSNFSSAVVNAYETGVESIPWHGKSYSQPPMEDQEPD